MNITDVLEGRAGLDGIHEVLCGPTWRSALRAALRDRLAQPVPLGRLRQHRVKFRTNRRLSAYGRMECGDRARPFAVTWTPEPLLPGEPDKVEREALARGLAAPFERLDIRLPARHMRVQISPHDEAFPQLVRLSDVGYLADFLNVGAPRAITPIRYRPQRRHVLRYDGVEDTAFLKLYRTAEEAGRAYRIAALVAGRLAAAAPWLSAAQPLGWSAPDAFVVHAPVWGMPLSRRLARRLSVAGQLTAAGTALRALHADGCPASADLKPHSFAAEVIRVHRACEHVSTLAPALGRRVELLLERVQSSYDRLPPAEPALVHGDPKCDHLWATPDGVALMDFDACRLTDPAHDLGKLLADLHWWHDRWRLHTLPAAQQALLDAYAPDGGTLRRARAYEVLALTKITAHRLWLSERDWMEHTERMIARSEGLLERLDATSPHPASLPRRQDAAKEAISR